MILAFLYVDGIHDNLVPITRSGLGKFNCIIVNFERAQQGIYLEINGAGGYFL